MTTSEAAGPAYHRRGHVLIIVENLPVPLDRRVWLEATLLARAGWKVSVICPAAHGYTQRHETIEGVQIHRHRLPVEAEGVLGFVLEYAAALLGETWLAWRIFLEDRFDVIQACNPPDDIVLVVLPFKWLFGTRFVFDHHDPFPEMAAVKFPRRAWVHRLALAFERLTFRAADRVVTTSASLRRIATGRGRVSEDRVQLVRSALDITRLPAVPADATLRRGRRHLVAYVGVMGPQDGVDLLLDAADHLVHGLGRRDIQFVLAGDGPHAAALRARCRAMRLDEHVSFLGYVVGEPFFRLLATADLGVAPDPPNAYNDKLHMNKLVEYMAFRLPVVMFGLVEGRAIAGEAADYAEGADARDLARRLAALLDDPERRRRMGEIGRRRVEEELCWSRQSAAYLAVYAGLAAG